MAGLWDREILANLASQYVSDFGMARNGFDSTGSRIAPQ
jgi:hypothetical protein